MERVFFRTTSVFALLFCTSLFSQLPAKSALLEDLIKDRDSVAEPLVRTSRNTAPAQYSITLKDSQLEKGIAVVVNPGQAIEGFPTLLVNGTSINQDPITTKAGFWFQVSEKPLVAGENLITVQNSEPGTTIEAFSLDHDSEYFHFGQFAKFSSIKTQPPVHSAQEMIDVQHLTLNLTLNMGSGSIPSATAELLIKSTDSSLSQCVLDLNDNGGSLVVSSVDDGNAANALSFTHSGSDDRLYIDLGQTIPEDDTFTVRIQYSGTPATGYHRTTHSGVPLIYTNNQPYDARAWLPCKDIPADKFTFEAYLTVPTTTYSGYGITPISNGKLISTTDNGNNTKTYHWNEEYKIASYLISICATNYRPSTAPYTALDGVTTMDITHFMYPERYTAAQNEVYNTITVMEYFADKFGEYPFLTEKYCTAGWNISSGMEHQTCTSMPDANLATPFHRRNIHEMAHMWFGDCITYETYSHLWLAEGWASYCEALMFGHLYGQSAYHDKMNSWTVSDGRTLINQNQDNFDTNTFRTAYYKGAWVLHMLRKVVGDDDFFAATKNYIASTQHRYDVADTDDFQSFFDAQTGQDMSQFFEQWTIRTSRPSYQWYWYTSNDGTDNFFSLNVGQVQSDSTYEMPLDIVITYDDASSETWTIQNSLVSESYTKNSGSKTAIDLQFDPDKWVLCYKQNISAPGAPTLAPTLLSVEATGVAGEVELTWGPYPGIDAAGYRIYASANGISNWGLLLDENSLPVAQTSTILSGQSTTSAQYYRLVAANNDQEGPPSDLYGTKLLGSREKCLIVDGYDRWTAQSVFAAIHGRAVAAFNTPFDTCANEAVGQSISLSDYPIVIWVLGDESTDDETFSSTEQTLVANYLDNGGALFVSGNEIGWDLGRSGTSSTEDVAFYQNYLKAQFIDDDSNTYTVNGTGGNSVFETVAYSFGSGDALYTPRYPDVIAPFGSDAAMEYNDGSLAGVQYFGSFGTKSDVNGGVIYLGFAFETLDSEIMREQVMAQVLSAFNQQSGLSDMWMFF